MLKLTKIAITGGLSCGKSSVCLFFKQLGAYVVSADKIVHELLSPKTNLGQKVISLLGSDVVNGPHFDRAKIADKVFHDPQLLQSYEGLLHPAVREEVERQYQQVKATQSAHLFIAEIPLLFETGGEKYFDMTIAVIADPKICKQRFSQITHYGPEEYQRRMERQLTPEKKAKLATYVIVNNGNINDLKQSVETLYHQLIKI